MDTTASISHDPSGTGRIALNPNDREAAALVYERFVREVAAQAARPATSYPGTSYVLTEAEYVLAMQRALISIRDESNPEPIRAFGKLVIDRDLKQWVCDGEFWCHKGNQLAWAELNACHGPVRVAPGVAL